ncbi:MAG: hypothetical protein ACYC4R_02295 [Anaerolineae bacterium]
MGYVVRHFGGPPAVVIIGGTHLGAADAGGIDHIVEALKAMGAPLVAPCTGGTVLEV